MLARLAHLIARRRWYVIGVWIVLTLFGGFAAGQVSKRWFQSFSIPGKSAYESDQRTFQTFHTGIRPPNVVVFHTNGDATKSDAIKQAMIRASEESPGSRSSSYFSTQNSMYVSRDKHTTFLEVYPSGKSTFDSTSGAVKMRDAAAKGLPAGITVNVTGHDPLEEASTTAPAAGRGLPRGSGRRHRRAGHPVLRLRDVARGADADRRRVAAILNTFTLVWILTYITDVSIIVQFLIALVGLGVAIDYALLMIFRFRDELREGKDVETALVETMTHAGRSVIVSGSTVAVGLLSLVILPLPFIRSMGIGGMLIPAVSVIAAITLLPAMLAVLGTRINSVRLLPKRFIDRGHPEDGAWGRWARFVNRRPAVVAVIGLVIVAILAGIGTQLNPNESQLKNFPGTGTAIAGRADARRRGISPGVMKPFQVLVQKGGDPQRDRRKDAQRSTASPARVRRPAGLAHGRTRSSRRSRRSTAPRRTSRTWSTAPTTCSSARPPRSAARRSRPRLHPRGLRELPVRARVRRDPDADPAGPCVQVDRAADQGGAPQPDLARGGVRDHRVHLPDGARLVPLEHRCDQAITAWIPLMVFAFLFGLSMDYEVFMLTRMREAYDETGSTEKAIELGLARTGKLVTSAALILMFAFLVLSSSPGFEIKEFAIGLAAGIIFDATVIRALLVPALMRLLGPANWWMPSWAETALFVGGRPSSCRTRAEDELTCARPGTSRRRPRATGAGAGEAAVRRRRRRGSGRSGRRRAFGAVGSRRSSISSRIIDTKAGCVPAVPARDNVEPELPRELDRLDVEVVEDLDVVGDEPDGRDDDVAHAARVRASRRWSQTSGSSHGTCGGPLRLW